MALEEIGNYSIVRERSVFDKHRQQRSLLVAYYADGSYVASGPQGHCHEMIKRDEQRRSWIKRNEDKRKEAESLKGQAAS